MASGAIPFYSFFVSPIVNTARSLERVVYDFFPLTKAVFCIKVCPWAPILLGTEICKGCMKNDRPTLE